MLKEARVTIENSDCQRCLSLENVNGEKMLNNADTK